MEEDAAFANLRDEMKQKDQLLENLRGELDDLRGKFNRQVVNLRKDAELEKKNLLLTNLREELKKNRLLSEKDLLIERITRENEMKTLQLQEARRNLHRKKTPGILAAPNNRDLRRLKKSRPSAIRLARCILNYYSLIVLVVIIFVGIRPLAKQCQVSKDMDKDVEGKECFSLERMQTQLFPYLKYDVTLTVANLVTVDLFMIIVSDVLGEPCTIGQNFSVYLEAHASSAKAFCVKASVVSIFPSVYIVSFSALARGRMKVRIFNIGNEISGSPFNATIYPNPYKLIPSIKTLALGLEKPRDIVFNSQDQMIVCEQDLSLRNKTGNLMYELNIHDTSAVAIDSGDNIYAVGLYWLKKLNKYGDIEKRIRRNTFSSPSSVTIGDHVFVYDRTSQLRDSDVIEVFDLDLNHNRTISLDPRIRGEKMTHSDGLFYIADNKNNIIHVVDLNGEILQDIGKGNITSPSAVHIVGEFLYVLHNCRQEITVFKTSGEFVNIFTVQYNEDKHGMCNIGSIASDGDKYFYIPDYDGGDIYIL